MQINTNATINAGLTSLLEATLSSFASTSVGTSAAGFGPAALLSLGQATSASNTGFGYTHLASAAAQFQSPITQQLSPKQLKAEQETVKQATVLRVNGQYDEARNLLEGLLKKNPTSGTAIHGLGAIELELGNYEKAESYFNKAHVFAPEYGFDRDANNAKILQQDDEYVLEQARRMTERDETRGDGVRLLVSLTRRSPTDAVARSLLAENLIKEGDATQGLVEYQLAISTANQTQSREIESKLADLVEVAPEAAYLRNLLGQVELNLGKHEQAAETLALATRLSDNDPLYQADEALAHVALGRDALAQGNRTSAMSSFQTAQGLDPLGDEVNLGLAEGYLALGQYRARLGDPGRAIEELNSAKGFLAMAESEELTSEIAATFYSVGRTLEQRRESSGEKVGDEAIAYQAAYNLDPENLTYQRKLAETQNTIGDEYLAEGSYKDAAYAYQYAYEVNSREESYKDSAISAFMNWGDERGEARDHHQAITAYQAAYDLDHDNETAKTSLADAFNTRGLFHKSLGEDFYEDAADDFLAALDLYPDNEDYQDNYDSVI